MRYLQKKIPRNSIGTMCATLFRLKSSGMAAIRYSRGQPSNIKRPVPLSVQMPKEVQGGGISAGSQKEGVIPGMGPEVVMCPEIDQRPTLSLPIGCTTSTSNTPGDHDVPTVNRLAWT